MSSSKATDSPTHGDSVPNVLSGKELEAGDQASPGTDIPEQDTRTRLLLAAGPEFGKSGYQRATLRDISQSANVNIASVAYYFGDKMGLYRAVIEQVRQSRERRFPAPSDSSEQNPEVMLTQLIHTMLSRMLKGDQYGWESQLIMREIDEPTLAFREMIEEFFKPVYDRLKSVLRALMQGDSGNDDAEAHVVEQFALSVVGQCLYYRIGRGVIEVLVPTEMQQQHFGIDSLCRHITANTLAAVREPEFNHLKNNIQIPPDTKPLSS